MAFQTSRTLSLGLRTFAHLKTKAALPTYFERIVGSTAAYGEAGTNLASLLVLSTRLRVTEQFMTTSTICLPAHILDAHITPRAREVLMLLASQTSAAEPALWICQKTIAERLRCSVATVARAIQKLVEAKLIAETGKLHQGKYGRQPHCLLRRDCTQTIRREQTAVQCDASAASLEDCIPQGLGNQT